ncbi:MAG: YqzM family protein [Novibacillus thermophilus]|jgi:hypothetical protein|nr:YqzM family protein [Novibacillus thermophilus]
MTEETQPSKRENRENDFMDMVVGTAVSFIFFMGIALIATLAEMLFA